MQEKRDSKKRRREMRQAEDGHQGEEPRCTRCGQELAPLEALLSHVCGRCVRKNHRRAVGK